MREGEREEEQCGRGGGGKEVSIMEAVHVPWWRPAHWVGQLLSGGEGMVRVELGYGDGGGGGLLACGAGLGWLLVVPRVEQEDVWRGGGGGRNS